MTLNYLIEKLQVAKEKVGGDTPVVMLNTVAENDWIDIDGVIVKQMIDQDGTKIDIAIAGSSGSSELAPADGTPHYEWNVEKDFV